MNKIFISISTLIISLASAQKSNETLMREFEQQRVENNQKFDAYVSKRYGTNRDPKISQEIEQQRISLAGFLPGDIPYFNTSNDFRQVKNANADYLQNGQINGLTGSFNGENIKFTIFDNGRVYANHDLFNNATDRITNKEASSLPYGNHATAVSGFVGAKTYSFTGSFSYSDGTVAATFTNLPLQGVAKNSTIDSYFMNQSVLPGNTTESDVFQKILIAQPKISNHSYGTTQGWTKDNVNGATAWVWNGAFASPNQSADAQGTYYSSDRDYDRIVYNNPSYIIIKASGNEYGLGPSAPNSSTYRNYYKVYTSATTFNYVEFTSTDTLPSRNCSAGYDCIGIGSLAKNIIVAGANDIITTNNERYTTASDVVHSDYSSAGPRDDGGIKPDISAVGTNVVSASSVNTAGTSRYSYGSGTSYSAPIVTGIIGLWTQINKQLFNNAELNAASAKTLMIHSASEAGSIGPDPHFGWGFINAKKGAELLLAKSNNSIIFNDETLTSGTPNVKTVVASGNEPLKITISWIDPEFTNFTNQWDNIYNNRTSKLINDLDVRIIDTTTNTISLPWRLDPTNPMIATKGDNTVDNVEQVIVDTPVAGRTYRIEITNKGNLVNNAGGAAPQNYSILITGYSTVLGTKEIANSNNNIAIAPTITKDIVKVLKAPKKSAFNVYDMTGKKLQSGTINNDQESIDLSTYTKGIYIIEIKTGKDVISKKVIKE